MKGPGKWFLAIGMYHAVLSLYTLLYIRPGTMNGARDPIEQATWLMSHRLAFSIGWLGWAAATLSLVAFFYLMRGELGASLKPMMTIALLMAVMGAVPDMTGGVIYGALLPQLIKGGTMAPFSFEFIQFGTLERLAVFLNAGLNNLLYALGGFILVAALARSQRASPAVTLLNWLTWISALGLSAAAFLLAQTWIFVMAAACMATFVALCLTLAWGPLKAVSE
ncbi:MAG: hypothetical protein ACREJQ_02775 [bacterium]